MFKQAFSPSLVYLIVGGLYAALVLWGFQTVADRVTHEIIACGGRPC